ncbi:Flp family type IVb pilin [Nevskia soli]|uniref:Flp family type IVb pilin n=1 Tax=Nevskia soli TaxID=418856 RepID=UPI001B8085CF|nr:Flp family type IVb pilin [Nevskia soli]
MLHKFSGCALKQRGVTATEYALIIVFVALVMIVGAQLLGANLSSLFSSFGAEV